jgi:hypothetical protein
MLLHRWINGCRLRIIFTRLWYRTAGPLPRSPSAAGTFFTLGERNRSPNRGLSRTQLSGTTRQIFTFDAVGWDRGFESGSLQRGVTSEPSSICPRRTNDLRPRLHRCVRNRSPWNPPPWKPPNLPPCILTKPPWNPAIPPPRKPPNPPPWKPPPPPRRAARHKRDLAS